jgi:hypothetical protein
MSSAAIAAIEIILDIFGLPSERRFKAFGLERPMRFPERVTTVQLVGQWQQRRSFGAGWCWFPRERANFGVYAPPDGAEFSVRVRNVAIDPVDRSAPRSIRTGYLVDRVGFAECYPAFVALALSGSEAMVPVWSSDVCR